MTVANRDGYDGPATLLAALTRSVLAKYAWSATSWNSPCRASLRDDRLRLTTSIPCAMTQARAARNARPLPRLSGPRTRIETSDAPGAIEWMIPAHAVP